VNFQAILANPENRREAATPHIESVGGALQSFWCPFGEHDDYILWEDPVQRVSMAARVIALAGFGRVLPGDA
jgi:uncharacterized protein with GYD domain